MQRRGIDDVVAEARRDLDRVAPADLAAEMAAGALVVDIRPVEQRHRDGDVAGAVLIGRNELEWRLDPASPDRIPETTDHDRRIIVVCNEGYASSLAAASLRRLGLRRATDLDGGLQAWRTFVDASRSEETRAHWEEIYGARAPIELSWFESEPAMSLGMIAAAKNVEPDTAIIDVGGGASTLVDVLVARGYRELTVLDVSQEALDIARRRLGEDAIKVRWVSHDVLTWRPARRYGLWHDRAVFHFLVAPDQRAAYLAVLHAALEPGGSVIVATFADDGPQMCSGPADRPLRARRPRRCVRSGPRGNDEPARGAPHPRRRRAALHLAPPPSPHLSRPYAGRPGRSMGTTRADPGRHGGSAV